jgi:hypothetical protein
MDLNDDEKKYINKNLNLLNIYLFYLHKNKKLNLKYFNESYFYFFVLKCVFVYPLL